MKLVIESTKNAGTRKLLMTDDAADELKRMEDLEMARKEMEKKPVSKKSFRQSDIWKVCALCFGRASFYLYLLYQNVWIYAKIPE